MLSAGSSTEIDLLFPFVSTGGIAWGVFPAGLALKALLQQSRLSTGAGRDLSGNHWVGFATVMCLARLVAFYSFSRQD